MDKEAKKKKIQKGFMKLILGLSNKSAKRDSIIDTSQRDAKGINLHSFFSSLCQSNSPLSYLLYEFLLQHSVLVLKGKYIRSAPKSYHAS